MRRVFLLCCDFFYIVMRRVLFYLYINGGCTVAVLDTSGPCTVAVLGTSGPYLFAVGLILSCHDALRELWLSGGMMACCSSGS
jgi:hypothetical protein